MRCRRFHELAARSSGRHINWVASFRISDAPPGPLPLKVRVLAALAEAMITATKETGPKVMKKNVALCVCVDEGCQCLLDCVLSQ